MLWNALSSSCWAALKLNWSSLRTTCTQTLILLTLHGFLSRLKKGMRFFFSCWHFSVLPLTWQVWNCIKCLSLKPFRNHEQFSFFSFHMYRNQHLRSWHHDRCLSGCWVIAIKWWNARLHPSYWFEFFETPLSQVYCIQSWNLSLLRVDSLNSSFRQWLLESLVIICGLLLRCIISWCWQ